MIKKSFLIAVFMVLASGALAHAACTPEEATAKAQEFMTAATTLAQKDAQKYQEVATAMQKELPALQQNATNGDLDAICKFYDEWIEKMR